MPFFTNPPSAPLPTQTLLISKTSAVKNGRLITLHTPSSTPIPLFHIASHTWSSKLRIYHALPSSPSTPGPESSLVTFHSMTSKVDIDMPSANFTIAPRHSLSRKFECVHPRLGKWVWKQKSSEWVLSDGEGVSLARYSGKVKDAATGKKELGFEVFANLEREVLEVLVVTAFAAMGPKKVGEKTNLVADVVGTIGG